MAGVTRLREYRQGTEASFREILPLKERERDRERKRVSGADSQKWRSE